MIIKQNVLLSSRERNDNINLIETESNNNLYSLFGKITSIMLLLKLYPKLFLLALTQCRFNQYFYNYILYKYKTI